MAGCVLKQLSLSLNDPIEAAMSWGDIFFYKAVLKFRFHRFAELNLARFDFLPTLVREIIHDYEVRLQETRLGSGS